jgi:SAM-dependent methyltransferase
MHEAPPPPRCPITGLPAARLVQRVSSNLLVGLWRGSFNIRTRHLLGHVPRLGLWESPCGLAFFDPMIAGDAAFYAEFYQRIQLHELLSAQEARPEFVRAASLVPPRARLLDVGGGGGGFARHIPHAHYVGLDPNATQVADGIDMRAETIEQHGAANAAAYDVVCAFQVVEHVADPLAFVRAMLVCLRPGGLLLIGVPLWPSPMTDIPNFVFNAPPHHLSWWTEDALRALAAALRLDAETVEPLPVGAHEGLLYWMGRCAPKLTGQRFFRAQWRWYGALAWAFAAGRIANALRKPPEHATRIIALMSARKPHDGMAITRSEIAEGNCSSSK